MKKNIIKTVLFLSLILLLGNSFARVLGFKYADGIQPMENFYDEPRNSIDVLCVGSSHMYCDINTKTLWENFGIAAYDLGGSVQPFWNSYFYIKEALETQKPAVVVLDVYRALEDREYVDHSRIIKNTFGIRSFDNRIMAIWASASKKQRPHYWLSFPTYHKRYEKITKANFYPQRLAPNFDNELMLCYSKGFMLMTATHKQKTEDISTASISQLPEKTNEYLEKIIILCKENNIPLLFIVTPYAGDNRSDESYFAKVAEIAQENGIPFVNFNHLRDEMGMDFSTDAVDVAHLNYRGSAKFTQYLGEYLKANYNLPDHRGEPAYASYDKMSRLLQWNIDNQLLTDAKDIDIFLKKAVKGKERYVTVLSLQGNCDIVRQNEEICSQMASLGIMSDALQDNSVWVIDGGKEQFASEAKAGFDWHMLMQDGFVRVMKKAQGQPIECNINREQQTFLPNGINIVVYDREMERIIERAGFPIENGEITKKTALAVSLR